MQKELYIFVLVLTLSALACKGQSNVHSLQTGALSSSTNQPTNQAIVTTAPNTTAAAPGLPASTPAQRPQPINTAPPPAQPRASFDRVTAVVFALLGFLISIFGEPLRFWLLRPEIKLSFRKDDMCMRETPAVICSRSSDGKIGPPSPTRMLSVRFYVENTRGFHARSCQAFLRKVEQKADDGTFKEVFVDRLPLKWSYASCEPTMVPGKTELYCDIFGATEQQNNLEVSCCDPKPKILREIFVHKAVYRFTAMVTAEHSKPATLRLCADWRGNWKIENVWQD